MKGLPEAEVCPSRRDIKDLLALARALRDRGRELLARPDRLQKQAETQLAELRKQQIRERLAATPIEDIDRVADRRWPLDPLERACLHTVADVLGTSQAQLARVPGLGAQTASQLIAAAGRLAILVSRNTDVRLDPAHRDCDQTVLLATLARLRRALDATVGLQLKIETLNSEIDELLAAAGPAGCRLRMRFSRRWYRDAAQVAAIHLRRFMFSRSTVSLAVELRQRCAELDVWQPDTEWLWRDYEADSASFHALLCGLSPHKQDLNGMRDLARLVLDHPLRATRRRRLWTRAT
jgi:hypothetical protein